MRTTVGRLAAAVTVLAVGPVIAAPTAGAGVSTGAFCTNVAAGSSGFTDIAGVAAQQRADIECLAAARITSGTAPGTYSPSGTVFRDSMATFVAKLVDTANALELTDLVDLPASGPDAFADDNGDVHEVNIDRLAAAGIVHGKTATTYGPTGPGNEVTRGQMATFLVSALDFLLPTDLPAGPDAFADDDGSVHEANIDTLAAIDIVDGVSATVYAPDSPLSRAQMASFLVRTLAYLDARGDIAALPADRRTIALSPAGSVTNTTDASPGDDIAFTASHIGVTDVDVALFPCENVTATGGVAFADSNDDGAADPGGDLVDADLVTVDGTAQDPDTESVSGAPVTGGSMTFAVDSPSIDCVHAVVWNDADDDDQLDVSVTGTPTEEFGISGQLFFVPPPATDGPMDENVVSNDEAGHRFIGCELGGTPPLGGAGLPPEQGPNAPSSTDCATFAYDSGDAFFIDANGDLAGQGGEAVSLATFQAALSAGDDVSGTYHADAAAQSSFVLTDESPAPPGGVTAQAVDADTVRVTFDEVTGADLYFVYRRPDAGPVGCTGSDPYTVAGSVAGGSADDDAGTTDSVDVNGLIPSTRYCFVVTAVDDGDESARSAGADATTAADSAPPVALDTELTISTSQARLDGGDVIQICFDQDIADPETDDSPLGDTESIDLADGDGTVVRLTQGANADFRRGTAALASPIAVAAPGSGTCAASRVLDVTVSNEPQILSAGATANIQFPADIVAAAEIEDTSGVLFQPAGDPDVRVDQEPGPEPD